jgi:hypothetical protein
VRNLIIDGHEAQLQAHSAKMQRMVKSKPKPPIAAEASPSADAEVAAQEAGDCLHPESARAATT